MYSAVDLVHCVLDIVTLACAYVEYYSDIVIPVVVGLTGTMNAVERVNERTALCLSDVEFGHKYMDTVVAGLSTEEMPADEKEALRAKLAELWDKHYINTIAFVMQVDPRRFKEGSTGPNNLGGKYERDAMQEFELRMQELVDTGGHVTVNPSPLSLAPHACTILYIDLRTSALGGPSCTP